MKNLVICFGCDEYENLSVLKGAAADSRRIFHLLTRSGLYDSTDSKLQLSPTVQEARVCLDHVASQQDLGVVTLYFAGHGGIKFGTFYLCFRDTDLTKLSTSSLPILDLFTMIGEIQPRQVNFIIDACQSAGAMFDLNALMKPEVIGHAGSSSIAFLAASASDQYAGETAHGGIATTAVMKYLTGERQIQNIRPFLDLVEVGLAVSRDVLTTTPDQSPVAWGLNLYGEGVFATNPHYTRSSIGPIYSIDGIAPSSTAGRLVQEHTESLWEEYRRVVSDHDVERLSKTIARMRLGLGDDFPSFIRGYASTLAGRASASADLLAASDALAVCAVALLPQLRQPNVEQVCRELLSQRARMDHSTVAELRRCLETDKYALLSGRHSLSDLHYLPIRVSRLLAWISLSQLADSILGLPDEVAVLDSNAVVELIFKHYRESLIAVSDEQAAWIFVFGALADRFGWSEKLELLGEKMFASELAVVGRVLRPSASGQDAFNYSLARAGVNSPIGYDELANPTELLSVLFLLGHRLGFAERWDKELAAMDGITLNAYVPDSYGHFGEATIRGGNNFTYRLGHDVWTLGEYVDAFARNVAPEVRAAARDLPPEGTLLCGLAACLFPNRVPYLLGTPKSEKRTALARS